MEKQTPQVNYNVFFQLFSELPFTPTKPTETERTAHSITVAWQPTGNHSIDSYTLYYREKSATQWIVVKDVRGQTSKTLDNLEPYTTYEFRVFAVNNIGLSKPSPLAEFTTLEKGMALFNFLFIQFFFSVKRIWLERGLLPTPLIHFYWTSDSDVEVIPKRNSSRISYQFLKNDLN